MWRKNEFKVELINRLKDIVQVLSTFPQIKNVAGARNYLLILFNLYPPQRRIIVLGLKHIILYFNTD